MSDKPAGMSRRALLTLSFGGAAMASAAGIAWLRNAPLLPGTGAGAGHPSPSGSPSTQHRPKGTHPAGTAPNPLWTYDTSELVDVPPVAVSDGLLVLKGYDGLIGLDTRTGKPLWTAGGFEPDGAPLLTGDGLLADVAYTVGAAAPRAVDPAAKGRVRWTLEPTGGLRFAQDALLASDSGALYLTASQGNPLDDDYAALLLAYDLRTRRELWRRTAGHSPSEAPAAVLPGDRLLCCDGRALTSYDRRTGEQQWSRALTGTGDGRPAVAGPRAYMAGGGITAVSLADGAVAWRYAPGGRTYSDPVIADGVLYATGPASGVLALDARTGGPLRESGPAPLTTGCAPVVHGGLLYALTSGHRPCVEAFDLRTHKAVWRYRAPGVKPDGAGGMRLAARGSVLFVQNGNTVTALPMG
ncbi:PQQ-binding-like beta-propeller repeat protein [Streptomyces sp. H10-C2]|uniref:PQQ-binding-like beta-propeller repeat protein n=1 Tax=unclassified Streptomyces TaxID=2593676 RepID=UPI0024B9E273|nr:MULTISPECIES: PQQ-binding-like beta-propeller repeat protein [unclassified Streptomyces]MDJ0342534.1 PQQ-binding-like beta-propeller repeat protein [Streptomyces sp. PH10-H1]MDJ0370569.1 PQQ-binding-like beta-propeller repeat protein [Streptomyces sp. H10-C2]